MRKVRHLDLEREQAAGSELPKRRHRWTSGGDGVTQYIWRCSKCGSSVNGSSRPHNRTCPRGGNCSWQKIH